MDDTWMRVIVTVLGMVVANLVTLRVLKAQIKHHEDKLGEFKVHTREDIRQLYKKVNLTMTRVEIETLVRSCTGDTNRLVLELTKEFRTMRDEIVELKAKTATNRSGYTRRATDK